MRKKELPATAPPAQYLVHMANFMMQLDPLRNRGTEPVRIGLNWNGANRTGIKMKSQIRTGTSQHRISYTYIDCFLNILCWPSKPSQALLPKLSSWRWGQIQIAFSFFGWKFGNFLGRLSRWNFLGGVEPSRWNFLGGSF